MRNRWTLLVTSVLLWAIVMASIPIYASEDISGTSMELQMQEAPTGLEGIATSTTGGTDGAILGVNNLMEYQSVESVDQSWKAVTGNVISDLKAGTYKVRYAAKLGYVAGKETTVVVAGVVQKVSCLVNESGTEMTLTLSSAVPGMTSDDIWLSDVTGKYPPQVTLVSEENGGLTYKIEVTLEANAKYLLSTQKDGYLFDENMPIVTGKFGQKAPEGLKGTAPTTEANNNGEISGVTEAMEYKLSTAADTAYVKVMGEVITGLASGTYSVRYAETETLKSSIALEVIIPEKSAEEVSLKILSDVAKDNHPNLRVVDYAVEDNSYKLIAGMNPKGENCYQILNYFELKGGSVKLYSYVNDGYVLVDPSHYTTTFVKNRLKLELYNVHNEIVQDYYVMIVGDLNCDGKITAMDTNILAQHVSNRRLIADDVIKKAADVVGDIKLSSSDVSGLKNHLTGIKPIVQ